MRVVLGVVREVEVEDHLEVVDIEAAGRDVGGDQELERALAELLHHAVALHLAQVAVEPVRRVAPRVEVLV